MRWMGHVSFIAEMGSVLCTKGRCRLEDIGFKWYDTVKIILREGVGCHFVFYLTILSISDWVVLNDMMIDDYWVTMYVEGNAYAHISGTHLEGHRKTMKNLRIDLCPNQSLFGHLVNN